MKQDGRQIDHGKCYYGKISKNGMGLGSINSMMVGIKWRGHI